MKLMKKFPFIAVSIVVMLLAVCLTVSAISESNGTCGINVSYNLSGNGSLLISGTGNVGPFGAESSPWHESAEEIVSLTIEKGISGIGENAFLNFSVVKVTIPESVTQIGVHALGYTYDGGVFSPIAGFTLKGVKGSAAEQYAAANGFSFDAVEPARPSGNFGALKWSMTSDNSLVISGSGPMPDLSSSSAAPWADKIGSIVDVTIEDGVSSIGSNVFSGTGISVVSIPSSVTKIGLGAFMNCSALTDCVIPSGVSEIGAGAFSGSVITSINLPLSVQKIGENSFANCTKLTSAYMQGVTEIGNGAFSGCSSLNYVNLGNALSVIGDNAFSNCDGLLQISFPETLQLIGSAAFFDCDALLTLSFPQNLTAIGERSFAGCNSLTAVETGNGLTVISAKAFEECTRLSNLTLGTALTTIESEAFISCNSLHNVQIPFNVRNLGAYSFGYGLVNGMYAHISDFSISGYTPSGASNYAETNYIRFNHIDYSTGDSGELSDGVKWSFDAVKGTLSVFGEGAIPDFMSLESPISAPWNVYSKYINSVTIGDGITEIGNNSFSMFSALTDVSISGTVTRIGSYSFAQTAIVRAILPESLTEIGEAAFQNCVLLQEVILPEGLQNIGQYAFRGDDMLKYITVPDSTSIGYNAIGFLFNDTKISDFTVIGKKGSMAESYAEANGLTFREAGTTTLVHEDSGAFIELSDIYSYGYYLHFEQIAQNAGDDIFLGTNYVASIYSFKVNASVLSNDGNSPVNSIIPEGLITYHLPRLDNIDILSLKVYAREGNLFVLIPNTFKDGNLVFSYSGKTEFIVTNADLSSLITITAEHKFSDGSEANTATAVYAMPNAAYTVRSTWVKGYTPTEKTISGIATENTVVSFTYIPEQISAPTADDEQGEDDGDDDSPVGKIVLIILLILVATIIIIAAVCVLYIYLKKRKDNERRLRPGNSIPPVTEEKFAKTIVVPEAPKHEIDIESLFLDDPEEDIKAVREEKKKKQTDKNNKQ